MDITLAWPLLLYLIIVVVILFLAVVNAMHIVRFGTFDSRNRVMVSVYAVLVLAILALTAAYFLGVDWSIPLHLSLPSLSTPTIPGA